MHGERGKTVVKAYYGRRRSGCITCKRRHVRCDEGQPICQNCSIGDRDCQYAQPLIPLRDRRKRELRANLPGEHEPWRPACDPSMVVESQVCRPLSCTAVDPFGTLPLGMTVKARELFHYYFAYDPTNYEAASKHTSTSLLMDGAGLALQDPIALQGTLLLAGTHYTWIHGSLLSFSETYLLYKIATIRAVNLALVDPRVWTRGKYARLVATLSLVECYSGNREATEAHLSGLATLMSARISQAEPCTPGRNLINRDEELTDRCVILLVIFIIALISRMELFHKNLPMEETVKLMREWRGGLAGRLSALRILPSFLLPPPINLRQPVDVSEILAAVLMVTQDCDRCFSPGEFDSVWRRGTPFRLLLKMISAHTSPPRSSRSPVLSSVSGMLAAVALYLGFILGVLGVGWKPFADLAPYMARVLMRDLGQSRGCMDDWDDGNRQNDGRDATCRDLWLWKAFTAYVSMGVIYGPEVPLMRAQLYEWIRECSAASGIREWEDAKEVFSRVAWPREKDNARFEAAWEDIVAWREGDDEGYSSRPCERIPFRHRDDGGLRW